MNERKLSREEKMILDGIEQDLRGDEPLDHRLRALGEENSPGGWIRRHRLGLATACLGIVCVALFVPTVATSSPALLWLFAAVWVVTAVCLIRWVERGWRRRRTAAARRKAATTP
ncbi:DUF3040 domain-containing protein [Streptomyces fradiae]|uniref:DUF3040 domain-containing protein n=1 Tax=Streptomyces fradiae TaxID=1906 RepID=UPI00351749DE